MNDLVKKGFVILCLFISCTPECVNDDDLGIYEIEIIQKGDFNKFELHSNLSSEEGGGSLIYSEDGSSKGVSYTFNQSDVNKKEIRFYTGKKAFGLLFTCSTLNINETERDSMCISVTGYYNGRKILDKTHTFYSYFPNELYQEIVLDNALSIQLRDYK